MPTTEPLRILSLGAGVQSSTVLLMSCVGELPRLDAAVFADTQWEPAEVYRHLDWLTGVAAESGIPVYRVTQGSVRDNALRSASNDDTATRWASIPFFIRTENGKGMLRRQCTSEFKIQPVDRFIRREILGLHPGQHAPRTPVVELWFGISADELRRVRISKERWKTNIYPLCNLPERYIEKPATRGNCLEWLAQHYPDRVVPRSSCLGCPYHSNAEWDALRRDPVAWNDIVEFDRAIRHSSRLNGDVFLHSSLLPIDEIDFSALKQSQQPPTWENECEGMCGV